MSAAPRMGMAMALRWSSLVLVGGLAAWLRYRLIEPPAIAQQCTAVAAPAWCVARQWLVLGFLSNGYGFAALAATVLALLWRRPFTAWMAAALGVAAVQLYCYQAGALALLVGCLLLLRAAPPSTAEPPPG